jgi:oligosaccharyltransferase complex subunit beta
MRWLLSFLLLGLLSVVSAVSSSGNKLLIVLEELADKAKYSKYLGDLESAYHSQEFSSFALKSY